MPLAGQLAYLGQEKNIGRPVPFAQSSFSSRRHQLRRRPALFRLASRRPTASSPPQESHSSVPHLPRHLVPPPDRDGPNLRRSSCARAHALRLAVGLLSGVPPAADRFDLPPPSPPQYATACPLLPSKKKTRFPACFSSGSRKIDPRVLT